MKISCKVFLQRSRKGNSFSQAVQTKKAGGYTVLTVFCFALVGTMWQRTFGKKSHQNCFLTI
jgi:hypothetical protein